MAKTAKADTTPLQQLKDLYAFMVEKGLASVEFSEKDFHVRLVRQGAYQAAAAAPAVSAPSGGGPAAPAAAAASDIPPGSVVVKSPMMGIFYRSASPSSPPYCKEGDTAKKGQVLCLIEAMKVFNEIRADFDCRVVKMLSENGKAIKSGQPLFAVEKL